MSDRFSQRRAATNPQTLFHHSHIARVKDCITYLAGLEDNVLLLELFFEIHLRSFQLVIQASP